jgi:CheY-like chemotaxis protein
MVDKPHLESCLLNLAVNARDAMPSGGTLTFELTLVNEIPADAIGMPKQHQRSFAKISVRDTGHGMPPHVRKRALEPFFTTKPVGAGTGLGLSMAYTFVQQSGGALLIESIEEVGTTVSIFLPTVGASESHTARSIMSGEGNAPVILVVDDDIGIREAIRELVDGHFSIVEAASAEEALRILSDASSRIDFVLSDVVMPGRTTGLEFLAKTLATHTELRGAFMSGKHHDIPADLAHIPLLLKPFTRVELHSLIENELANSLRR